MAKIVIKNAVTLLAATDYSAQIKSSTLTLEAPEVDVTNMGSGGWVELLGGIKKGTLAFEFVKDSDLSGLTAAMVAALGTVIAFDVKAQSAATSTTNRRYTGNVLVTSWQPVAGQVGSAFGSSVSWPTTGAVVEQTS